MEEKFEMEKQTTRSLLEKSRALRLKAKETETELNELKAKVEEFIHPDQDKSKKNSYS